MKTIAAFALALTLAGGAFTSDAFAQNRSDRTERADRDRDRDREHDRPTIGQLTAQDDARIAQLKADLRLKADQESEWGKLEAALKDISKRRAEQRIARIDEMDTRDKDRDVRDKDRDVRDKDREAKDKDAKENQKPVTITMADGLRRQADRLARQAEDLRAIADASAPLLDKLDDNQRRRVGRIINNYTQVGYERDDDDDRPRWRRRNRY